MWKKEDGHEEQEALSSEPARRRRHGHYMHTKTVEGMRSTYQPGIRFPKITYQGERLAPPAPQITGNKAITVIGHAGARPLSPEISWHVWVGAYQPAGAWQLARVKWATNARREPQPSEDRRSPPKLLASGVRRLVRGFRPRVGVWLVARADNGSRYDRRGHVISRAEETTPAFYAGTTSQYTSQALIKTGAMIISKWRQGLRTVLTLLILSVAVDCQSSPSPTETPDRTPYTGKLVKQTDALSVDAISPETSPAASHEEETTKKSGSARKHQGLPVLGYVTPWNSRGKQLVEDYRERFDIVSPVWYTVHTDPDSNKVYRVEGAPPGEEDEAWYKRLQEPSASSSKAIKVAPRFILDGWNQADYSSLVFNETRWEILASTIWNVVDAMSYDGVVFESIATHALVGPLKALSERLHSHSKELVLVMPPIRTTGGFDSQNTMLLESLPSLAKITDYFSIMTYDMTGPAGHETSHTFPERTRLHGAKSQGHVREPGPNTALDWVRDNLISFSTGSTSTGSPEFGMGQEFQFSEEISAKFLMGLPLYGYTYPVIFASVKQGSVLQKPTSDPDTIAVMRGAGKAVTALEIETLLEEHGSEVREGHDGEHSFDYREEDGWWRAFIPTQKGMTNILQVLGQDLDVAQQSSSTYPVRAGVALWEVGQSSPGLLEVL
ncbi:hypothetical protein JX265_013053 [Neoarthrinium moseri]|uniref:Chitinase domain-containing protein 1 n=1 Tax=Neoarthrinium moseri TaxID=1658444 RepID=A0A9P9W9J8_9PEZI|nr:uncharacterized protein JN550_005832 [Neoarthrinium moseri]KAI1852200.1 hypothetical protein JX265_013053 [Neoarthrinium moseri]KAI1869202.1 hypothetical protein JN550_005832 [Neoarthrinium moseri]